MNSMDKATARPWRVVANDTECVPKEIYPLLVEQPDGYALAYASQPALLRELVKQIQRDAFKAGMTEAATIAEEHYEDQNFD